MSSTPIRHGSTAHAAATRQAEHDPKHTPNHRHHAHTGHGQFGNYVFRYGRPAPPVPRRPVPLRARQKPPSAQSGAAEHEPEHFDPSANMSARTGSLDDEGTRPANMDGMPDDDASHDQTGQRRSRSRPQVRVMPEPTPSAKTLETLLEQLCGEPAQVLCRKTGANDGTNVGTIARAEHAQALLGVLLAIAPDMATGNTKLSAQALQLTAVRAYLRSGERGPFTTLERVKQVLMENSASKRTQGTRTAAPAPISEKQQDRHLLLPLMLLNADRLRLDDQRDQACDRMELLSASRHMQVPRT